MWKNVFSAAMALASVPAAAQARDTGDPHGHRAGPEIAVGVFAHGANFHPLGEKLVFPKLPAGEFYEGDETGTADIQLIYRSAPLRWLLKPRLTARLQINTAGETNFAAVGAEWRQHSLHRRLYGQIGIGIAVHDAYIRTPDPFAPGLSGMEARRRLDIFLNRAGFGSRVLFNPNASIGFRIDRRWAAEVAWEHFSHHQLFSEQNPGIDHLGIRLVRTLGR